MSAEDRAALARDLDRAGRVVAPVWPVERFVAVNPYVALVDRGFDAALAEAREWLGTRGLPGAEPARRRTRVLERARGDEVAEAVDELVHDWLPELVAGHAEASTSPYERWRALARGDRRLRRLAGRDVRARIDALPDRADDAACAALAGLGVATYARWAELRAQMVRSLGWAGYATWCDAWAAPDDPAPRIGVRDLVAIRTCTDWLVLQGGRDGDPVAAVDRPAAPPPAAAVRALADAEDDLRGALVGTLRQAAVGDEPEPAAQVVCCIDARSEGLRRHLEAAGPYATLGFAGFFGVPARVRPWASAEAHQSAPVLLSPTVELVERADDRLAEDRAAAARGATQAADAAAHGGAMFGWAEASGWVAGLGALARALGLPPPTGAAAPPTWIDVTAFAPGEQADLVATALRTMGLTSGFAPLVVLCAHGSTSTANAHAAALDCGACAGHRGGANARALAAMANDPEVRRLLATRGVDIPAGTLVVAAEHDTTTDRVVLHDLDRVPEEHRWAVTLLEADLERAGRALAAERAADLGAEGGPGSAAAAARRRSTDWAQLRPEWGLARNAAFVVAPRRTSRGADLGRRAFLHSYDPEADVDGAALETILTAPMVVAQWINAQYFASTVDPEVLGAGDKTTHNPIPGVGVLAGGGGDLRVGLPWQSVADASGPVHQPVRLQVVVEAPPERVEAVIDRNPILQHLFDGAWVHLVVHPPGSDRWSLRRPGGALEPIVPEEAPCPSPA